MTFQYLSEGRRDLVDVLLFFDDNFLHLVVENEQIRSECHVKTDDSSQGFIQVDLMIYNCPVLIG